MKNVKKINQKSEIDDVENIKKFLLGLGFFCSSHPTAKLQVYSKNKNKVIISNNRKN